MLKIFKNFGSYKKSYKFPKSEPDTTLFEGPSGSGIKSVTCTVGVLGVTQCVQASPTNGANDENFIELNIPRKELPIPDTPGSSSPTTPIIYPSLDPVNQENIDKMPAKTTTHQKHPATTTTTTTAEISDENRYSILDKETEGYAHPYDDLGGLNTSAGSNESGSHDSETTSATTSTKSTKTTKSSSSTPDSSPKKKHRNHNNNHQSDVNSIESISDDMKMPNSNLEWIDELQLERDAAEIMRKSEHKKKKKKRHATTKTMDQLDGVPVKSNTNESSTSEDESDKMVTCLYYTLMCCECAIS